MTRILYQYLKCKPVRIGLIFLLVTSINDLNATDRYVKVGGSGAGTGVDWDNAMSSISAAVSAANAASPTVNHVYVAAGLYSLTGQVITANVSITIQGGFPNSATGTDISGYNATSNVTTINGNGFGIFKVPDLYSSAPLASHALVIKGFTLAEGVATSGSVFYSASNTSTTSTYDFADLRVLNNSAENGAFFFTTVNGPTVNFTNCEFNGNRSFNGGSIHITTATNSNFTINGCSFSNGTAENGGAIYNTTGPTISSGVFKMKIINSSFCNNHSSLYGGAIYTTTAPIEVTNCTFTNNSTKVNFWGGAIFATTSSVNCTGSTFFGNHSDLGGAVYQTTAQNVLSHYDNCIFAYNFNIDQERLVGPADGGGALHLEGTFVNYTVNNSVFYRNSVPGGTFGGAICASGLAVCTQMDNTIFFENRIGTSTTGLGVDINAYLAPAAFNNITNSKFQNASAAAYVTQIGASAAQFVFGSGNTFSNTTMDGGAGALSAGSCPVNLISIGSITTANTGVGTIDCSKTQLNPAPIAGVPSQLSLVVTINVTTAGTFTPLSVSGSGMSLANGVTSVTTATTGIQTFSIPIKYDGSALATMNFQVGSLVACAADLTKAPKSVISKIWTLDNCSPIQVGPSLK